MTISDEHVELVAGHLRALGWSAGGDYDEDFKPDVRAALEHYSASQAQDHCQGMFMAAVDSIAEISSALGIPEEDASVANGNAMILDAIAELVERANPPPTAEPAIGADGGVGVGCTSHSAEPVAQAVDGAMIERARNRYRFVRGLNDECEDDTIAWKEAIAAALTGKQP